ncbi:MAG: glutamine-hydrolyzing carbamoyl-phosphate synthase small subunit [Patescibacteria group bacterium]
MLNKKQEKNLAKLILKDGTKFFGKSFGAMQSISGEVVFATGMVGYPEALTDPSFAGQILVLTYPIIGNYGVPEKKFWESDKVQVSGLIVCDYIDTPSHFAMQMKLGEWLKKEKIPALEIKDTRLLTQKLRNEGVMLGKIQIGKRAIKFEDPNKRNLVAEVSTKKIYEIYPYPVSPYSRGRRKEGVKTIVLIDCGVKQNIVHRLVARNLKVIIVPWNTDITKLKFTVDAVVISNGPGDPQKAKMTIQNIKKIMEKKIPLLGICLGNQLLALALGGTTYKLKFGHRSQNQPVVERGTKKCYLTTQNHGFAVKKIPRDFKEWFYNANDNTNEGIMHKSLPVMSVQFHPESSPGPLDTDWIFDFFLKKANIYGKK